MIRSMVRGVGSYLPERCISNDELSKTVDTNDEWIRGRTGITQRYFAAEGELTSDLAAAAAKQALDRAGLDASTVDMVLVATSTPDNTFPATATAVQHKLNCGPGIAFDVQAVCAGFPYALATADNFIKAGMAKRALVIGAETFSRILDFDDRSTCVLFGDGAGAFVLDGEENAKPDGPGLLQCALNADGQHYQHLYVDGGPSRRSTSDNNGVGFLRMNGREVFRHAVEKLTDVAMRVLEREGLNHDQLDWLIPHQANQRIIDGVGKRLGLSTDRVISTVGKHANTSAASIPLAFSSAIEEDKLGAGDIIVANAIGGGFAWGAVLLRWG